MSKLLLRIARSCGLFSLARTATAGMARILMYHNFSASGSDEPGSLSVGGIRTQFEHLRRHYEVVSLQYLAEQACSRRKLQPRMVALTIDDGRRNCYEFLFPLLKEFQFPATFFVVTSFIEGQDWIWTDKVLWLSEQPGAPEELAQSYIEATFRSLNRMKPEERDGRIEAIAKNTGVQIPRLGPAKYAPCSWSELREMADCGLVDIGSHTATHPILSSVSDEESLKELTQSRALIEERIGKPVSCFCFPNGMPGDFRPSQVRQVEQAGYKCSVVAQFGMVKVGSDPYQLPRIGAGSKARSLEFSKYVDGLAYFQRKLDF